MNSDLKRPAKKLSKKQIDQTVNDLFKRLADSIQFNIFDVGKVLDAARKPLLNGGTEADAEVAIKEAIEVYRVKP